MGGFFNIFNIQLLRRNYYYNYPPQKTPTLTLGNQQPKLVQC